MPLRRSPLFCARNSRLRGGEDPGRGRRGPRSREEEAPVAGGGFGCGAEDGRNMEMAGRGACAEGRDAGADGRELRGTRGRPLSGGRRSRRVVKSSRASSRDAGVADRCRTVPGSGRRLACRGGKIGPRARGGFSRCRRNGVKRADFRLRVWKYGRKGYLCPRKRFPRGAAAGIKRECSASLQQFPLL